MGQSDLLAISFAVLAFFAVRNTPENQASNTTIQGTLTTCRPAALLSSQFGHGNANGQGHGLE
jgi:hypothetical protein